MPIRFREWQFRRRIELGTDFLVTGPVLDPDVIGPEMEQAARDAGAAGVVLMGLKFSSVVDEAAQAWLELQ